MSGRISKKDTKGATIIQLRLDLFCKFAMITISPNVRKLFESGASIPKNYLYGGTWLLFLNKTFSSIVAHAANSVHNSWRKFGVKSAPFKMLRILPCNVANLRSHFPLCWGLPFDMYSNLIPNPSLLDNSSNYLFSPVLSQRIIVAFFLPCLSCKSSINFIIVVARSL